MTNGNCSMKINPKHLDRFLDDEFVPTPEPKLKKLRIKTPEGGARKPDRTKIRKAKREQTTDRK